MAAAQSGNDWRIGGITQSSGRMSPHRHLRHARCVSDASLSGSRVTIRSTENHANSQMSPQRPQGVAAACFAARRASRPATSNGLRTASTDCDVARGARKSQCGRQNSGRLGVQRQLRRHADAGLRSLRRQAHESRPCRACGKAHRTLLAEDSGRRPGSGMRSSHDPREPEKLLIDDAQWRGDRAGGVRATIDRIAAGLARRCELDSAFDVSRIVFRSGVSLQSTAPLSATVVRSPSRCIRRLATWSTSARPLPASVGWPTRGTLPDPAGRSCHHHGLTAVIETLLTDGEPGNGPEPSTRQAMARALYAQIVLLHGVDVDGLLAGAPAWSCYEHGPWPNHTSRSSTSPSRRRCSPGSTSWPD